MNKVAFKPFSIVSGLVAGIVAAKLFERIWSLFDKQEEGAPDPKREDEDWRKLIAALALEGAIFRVVRGAVDHGIRRAFSRSVGEWPGEKAAHS